ncbi:MAG: hypothetical protein LBB63_01045 [Holosporaceae bacterium]|nr:hypothetical protein [Holosporaceae bacterium]
MAFSVEKQLRIGVEMINRTFGGLIPGILLVFQVNCQDSSSVACLAAVGNLSIFVPICDRCHGGAVANEYTIASGQRLLNLYEGLREIEKGLGARKSLPYVSFPSDRDSVGVSTLYFEDFMKCGHQLLYSLRNGERQVQGAFLGVKGENLQLRDGATLRYLLSELQELQRKDSESTIDSIMIPK